MGPALLLLSGLAAAHPAAASAALLDIGADRVGLELHLPADQLAMALQGTPNPTSELPPLAVLARYASNHVELTDAWGARLDVELTSADWAEIDGVRQLVVRQELRRPAGSNLERLTLRDTAIADVVASHRIYVSVRRDLGQGKISGSPELAGVLNHRRTELVLERAGAGQGRGAAAALALGARHIAEGADHLLFLLCLLLVAPLRAVNGRWAPETGRWRITRRGLGMVTAFTLGHSATLALGALGWAALPSAAVEIAIALSIAVSAAHALRPLFPGREAVVAAGFGLVHGLAFAAALDGLGFDPWGLVTVLAGFNAGIELVQLAVVAVAAPALLLLLRGPWGAFVRRLGAGAAGLASLTWIGQRALDLPNPLAAPLEAARAHAPALAVALYTLAAASALCQRRARTAEAPADTRSPTGALR